MTWTDIPALARLDRELFGHDAWSEQTWWAELAQRPRRDYAVLVSSEAAGTAGEILGYAGADLAGDVADVLTLAGAPRAQGAGRGRMLLTWLEATARDFGAEHLMLEVRADNDAALRLYERAGFATLTVRRRYYQPGDVDALIMRKDLRHEHAAD